MTVREGKYSVCRFLALLLSEIKEQGVRKGKVRGVETANRENIHPALNGLHIK